MGKIDKIKLKDFKSFRNAVIPFVDGFIAVVGPNGSGKSNILDAILFVLGEGSMKALRAGRVRDLVHHSSKTGTADATIELRRGRDKIRITRQIDRNGSSVYRIDGKRATRTDVLELISSIGIPLEGYNIILQGEVNSFIKKTPIQRREVIDQISGVSEYEEKKEKALRELEKVEEKIKDANLILHEKKGYIGQLKKERDEAVRYRNYQKKFQTIRANIIKRELDRVQAKFDERVKELGERKREFEGVKSKIDNVSASINELQLDLEKINSEIIGKGEKEHMQVMKDIESTRTEIKYMQNRYSENADKIVKLKNELDALKVDISKLEAEIEKKEKSLASLENELKKYNERVSEKEDEINSFRRYMEENNMFVSSIVERIDDYSSKIDKLQKEFYEVLSDINSSKEKMSALRLAISRISKDIGTQEDKEIYKKLEEMKRYIASKKRAILDIEDKISGMFSDERRLNAEYAEIEKKLDDSKERYHSLQSKIVTIRAVTGNTASDAVIEASKNGELSGIVGKVEDLFDYPDEYSIGIQTAAGPRMNFIVTKDDISATNAVKWLKRKRIGRTSFIPLNKIRPSLNLDKSLIGNEGVVGYIIDIIKFEKRFRPIFEYVFGDTLLIKDIDTARRVGIGKARMVTLDGDLVERIGVITGGFREGVFTLKDIKERDNLKREIEKLESEKNRVISKIEKLRADTDSLRKEKSELEVSLKEKETEMKSIEDKLKQFLESKRERENEVSRLESQITGLEELITSKEKRLRELKQEIDRLDKERSSLKVKLGDPNIKEAAKKLNKMQKSLESLKSNRTGIEIRYKSLLSELDLLRDTRLREMKARESEIISELEKISKEQGDLKSRIYDMEKKLDGMMKKEESISSSLSGLTSKKDDIQTRINKLAEEKGSLSRILENKRREVNEISVDLAKIEIKLDDLKHEWNELSSSYKEIQMSESELKSELESLRKKMAKLEPVNLRAIEAYESAMKELGDIEEKAKKLEDERASVLNLISQIEKRKVTVFMKTFESIRSNFQRVYKDFTQDQSAYADIRLENEKDPFSGGLIVEARPSGKPVKRIESLSGGEQAVVALTFFFAIQEYKPSPFYVWDEVDAPLDKLNSERLAGYIKERSKVSQFIVMTHNAALIHEADQIIGVSMNKKLGSSVVEVDMRDYFKG